MKIFNGGTYSQSDDPYYCGLRARIPNFAKSKSQKEKEANAIYARLPAHQQSALLAAAAAANAAAAAGGGHPPHHPGMGHPQAGHWQGPARPGPYLDNGKTGSGRQTPTRTQPPPCTRNLYILRYTLVQKRAHFYIRTYFKAHRWVYGTYSTAMLHFSHVLAILVVRRQRRRRRRPDGVQRGGQRKRGLLLPEPAVREEPNHVGAGGAPEKR